MVTVGWSTTDRVAFVGKNGLAIPTRSVIIGSQNTKHNRMHIDYTLGHSQVRDRSLAFRCPDGCLHGRHGVCGWDFSSPLVMNES